MSANSHLPLCKEAFERCNALGNILYSDARVLVVSGAELLQLLVQRIERCLHTSRLRKATRLTLTIGAFILSSRLRALWHCSRSHQAVP